MEAAKKPLTIKVQIGHNTNFIHELRYDEAPEIIRNAVDDVDVDDQLKPLIVPAPDGWTVLCDRALDTYKRYKVISVVDLTDEEKCALRTIGSLLNLGVDVQIATQTAYYQSQKPRGELLDLINYATSWRHTWGPSRPYLVKQNIARDLLKHVATRWRDVIEPYRAEYTKGYNRMSVLEASIGGKPVLKVDLQPNNLYRVTICGVQYENAMEVPLAASWKRGKWDPRRAPDDELFTFGHEWLECCANYTSITEYHFCGMEQEQHLTIVNTFAERFTFAKEINVAGILELLRIIASSPSIVASTAFADLV